MVIGEDVAIGAYDDTRSHTGPHAWRRCILALTAALSTRLSEELKWVDAFAAITNAGNTGSARRSNFRLDTDCCRACIVGNIDKCTFKSTSGGAVFCLGTLWVIRLERPARGEEHRDGGERAANCHDWQGHPPQTGDEFRHWVSPNGCQWVIACPKDIALPGLYETGMYAVPRLIGTSMH